MTIVYNFDKIFMTGALPFTAIEARNPRPLEKAVFGLLFWFAQGFTPMHRVPSPFVKKIYHGAKHSCDKSYINSGIYAMG